MPLCESCQKLKLHASAQVLDCSRPLSAARRFGHVVSPETWQGNIDRLGKESATTVQVAIKLLAMHPERIHRP